MVVLDSSDCLSSLNHNSIFINPTAPPLIASFNGLTSSHFFGSYAVIQELQACHSLERETRSRRGTLLIFKIRKEHQGILIFPALPSPLVFRGQRTPQLGNYIQFDTTFSKRIDNQKPATLKFGVISLKMELNKKDFSLACFERLLEFVKIKAMNIASVPLLVVEWQEYLSNVGDNLDKRVNNAPQLLDKLSFSGVWWYGTFLRVGPLNCAHVVLTHSYFKDFAEVLLSPLPFQLPFHWLFDRGKQLHRKLSCQRYVSVATCSYCSIGWWTRNSDFAINGQNLNPWDGLTLADFIMPFFLCIVGISLALAYKNLSCRAVATRKAILWALKLLMLGLFLQGGFFHGLNDLTHGVDIDIMRWMGILQRIAIAYLLAALCEIWLKGDVHCNNVLVENITAHAPPESPYTCGIIPDSSEYVCIQNCNISMGYDAIVLKIGWNESGI